MLHQVDRQLSQMCSDNARPTGSEQFSFTRPKRDSVVQSASMFYSERPFTSSLAVMLIGPSNLILCFYLNVKRYWKKTQRLTPKAYTKLKLILLGIHIKYFFFTSSLCTGIKKK